LERKLVYSMGNWIQWQAFNDPFMLEIVERSLGLLRADRTENPSMEVVRRLAMTEERARKYHIKRDETQTKILIVLPTSGYFSVDSNLVMKGILKTLKVVFEDMHLQADVVLESLLVPENMSQIGEPKLIIVPSLLALCDCAWEMLKRLARNGATVLVSGQTQQDEYWKKAYRVEELKIKVDIEPLYGIERMMIDDVAYDFSFRETLEYYLPMTVLSKLRFEQTNKHPIDNEDYELQHKPINVVYHHGQFILSPFPVEFSHSSDGIKALYAYAAKCAKVENTIFVLLKPCREDILIYPTVYESTTVYTLVNEGYTTTLYFQDLRSNVKLEVEIMSQRGVKLWIGTDGTVQEAYLNGRINRVM